jgi:hypothetical protein
MAAASAALPPQLWITRCARRISEVDIEIAEAEARRLARDIKRFERTGAMAPEDAVDFIAREMANPHRGPFERRKTHRD